MASTEKPLCRGSFHAASHRSSCTEEDIGDLHDPLEEVQEVEVDPHGQPARTVTDPGQIAWCALDLNFPMEESESDWSDWSDADGQVIEKDCPGNEVVDGGRDDDDDDCNGRVVNENNKTNSKIICPGKLYPESKAMEMDEEWIQRHWKQMQEYFDMWDDIVAREDDDTPFPPFPLKLFPPATALCVLDANCHHRAYKTHDTSTTPSTLGHRTPHEMLQIFSMSLSGSGLSYPVSVYGIFAVRDNLDPRRNCVFDCPRDAAVEIGKQESFDLPL